TSSASRHIDDLSNYVRDFVLTDIPRSHWGKSSRIDEVETNERHISQESSISNLDRVGAVYACHGPKLDGFRAIDHRRHKLQQVRHGRCDPMQSASRNGVSPH